MKNIFYSAILILIFLVGCTPTPPPTPPNSNPHGIYVDSSVFFKLTFQGRTIATYEVRSTDSSYDHMLKSNQALGAAITSYSGGSPFNNLSIAVSTINLNSELQALGLSSLRGQVYLGSGLLKDGMAPLGAYSSGSNWGFYDWSSSSTSYIFYLITGSSGYPNNTSTITLTSIDQNFVTGIASLYIIQNNDLIPVTGSFRLHKIL